MTSAHRTYTYLPNRGFVDQLWQQVMWPECLLDNQSRSQLVTQVQPRRHRQTDDLTPALSLCARIRPFEHRQMCVCVCISVSDLYKDQFSLITRTTWGRRHPAATIWATQSTNQCLHLQTHCRLLWWRNVGTKFVCSEFSHIVVIESRLKQTKNWLNELTNSVWLTDNMNKTTEDLSPLKTVNWFYDASMAQSTKVKTIKLDLSFLQLTEAAEWQHTLGDWISIVGLIEFSGSYLQSLPAVGGS